MQMNKAQNKEQQDYQKRVEQAEPKSPIIKDCLFAFLSGGAICAFGQGVSEFAKAVMKLDKTAASAFTSIFLVFLAATLTGLGLYAKIGKYCGAGSIVPITGFANSIVSPAMEFRREGLVMGVGAKMFTIAGPVLVYGVGASVIAGLIAYALS